MLIETFPKRHAAVIIDPGGAGAKYKYNPHFSDFYLLQMLKTMFSFHFTIMHEAVLFYHTKFYKKPSKVIGCNRFKCEKVYRSVNTFAMHCNEIVEEASLSSLTVGLFAFRIMLAGNRFSQRGA
ncbi:hypothetical protein XENOCAPTIV_015484 [Xenoophorus captivus]|uniref:Uncharacterized protein n=1 Tax=Xenoophorus captivus TaxID=1517983 RepID=A0ABV0QWT2_9TELE